MKHPCVKDCPNRSMECRLTCEAYAAYRAKKDEEYRRRAHYMESQPESKGRERQSRINTRRRLRGRK